MKKQLNLNEKEARIVWTALNNAQAQGVNFLINYESGLMKGKELKKWYEEAKEEFNTLQKVKEVLDDKPIKKKVKQPKTIMEAIEDLHIFFQEDMWHASREEWNTEEDMVTYLELHFKILKKQVRELQNAK